MDNKRIAKDLLQLAKELRKSKDRVGDQFRQELFILSDLHDDTVDEMRSFTKYMKDFWNKVTKLQKDSRERDKDAYKEYNKLAKDIEKQMDIINGAFDEILSIIRQAEDVES